MTDTVETYLACMAAHEWDGLAATLADAGLTRDGPFCTAASRQATLRRLPAWHHHLLEATS